MELAKRIESFIKLGEELNNLSANAYNKNKLSDIIKKASKKNQWFTDHNIIQAINSLSKKLTDKNLSQWLSKYPNLALKRREKKIGVIMAGNIPLVGFHDLLCILISGNKIIIKPSSKDEVLFKFIINLLININQEFNKKISFTDNLKSCDAFIGTGSNNTARYFEYYFRNTPNIIRKNKNSAAILTGNESLSEIKDLGQDIFLYFGLGCRNVSKLYIPHNFDLNILNKAFIQYNDIIDHQKYSNNYIYNKSIFLMDNVPFKDGSFFLLKEDTGFSSPVSVIYYEYYKNIKHLVKNLEIQKENLQCIVTNDLKIQSKIQLGQAQHPDLWDYADDKDTIKFLLNLH